MAGIRQLCRLPEAGLLVRHVGRSVAQRRPFAAAALLCDHDDEYSTEVGRRWPSPRAEEAAAETVRGVQWVLIGDPGVQKHVYAARLSRLLQVPHINMGCLVRQELYPRSSLYKQIANAVNEGRLVPEDVIFGLLSKRLEEGYYRGETGFILDGIPRTRIQAEILDQIADVDLVVNLKCEGECFLKNNMGSGVCSHCGQAFGAKTRSELCISHRQLKSTPSNVHALKEKFRVYAEQSKPLEDYYKKKGKLLNFSGGRWAWRDLAETLGCFASPTHSRFVFLFPEIDCIVDWRPKTMPVSTLSFACPFLRL